MKYFAACLFCLLPLLLWSQNKPLDHADVQRWRRIEQNRLSNDGQWVAYTLLPVTETDPSLQVWNARTGQTTVYLRATDARFSEDSKFLIFRIKPPSDTLKNMRRRKVKEEELPKDTLGILTLATGQVEKIARLKSFTVPEKWSGWMAYQLETGKVVPPKKDTASMKNSLTDTVKVAAKPVQPKSSKKPKKEDKENGTRLFLRNMTTGATDTLAYVQSFVFAEKAKNLLFQTGGPGDTLTFSAKQNSLQAGVYYADLEQHTSRPLWRGKGKYQQLSLNESGRQAAFLANMDTTKARIQPWQLCHWAGDLRDSARVLADATSSFLPDINQPQPGQGNKWMLSENARLEFSEDGSKLYFGIAPPPVLNDTMLLPEEIVNVEVWSWQEGRMYTQQEAQWDTEKKRSYPVVWHTKSKKFVVLATPENPEVRFQEQHDADLALGFTEEPYTAYIQSEGVAYKDLYAIDLNNGDKKQIVKGLRCSPRLSPAGQYIAWWSDPDTAWFAWNARKTTIARLTDNRTVAFFNERNDTPDFPDPHGMMGWLDNDAAMLVYDRYDIWKIDPAGQQKPERLTRGRETQTTYRYLRLDPEEHSIAPKARLLLHQFNNVTKAEGYAWLQLGSNALTLWISGQFAYSRTPQKARNAEKLLFTKENFQTFPDLQWIDYENNSQVEQRISNANPQQSDYRWGTIEPFQWTSLAGEKLDGLLIKPSDFDPAKKYPMLVNFYERSSDELNRHRTPDFGRSTINWSFYASRGYVLFIPDIVYRTGYPGESAYDAVVSGVTKLIDMGFVDAAHIGLQGHSWGGYQIAYLVTRTNLFACAEAGAPVANMTSAYGGIRWGSGLNRAFQYEHQQSRIGGTLWQYPLRYIENSPIFALEKVETPLLILDNDQDDAVPWYQGIELYSGLRRLGKPTWLLNYNEEKHWPQKLQNRTDFQHRLQQFFDYYLLGAPQPPWMQRGVPPGEKGILQGLD